MGIDEAGIQVVFPFICNAGKEQIFTGCFLCCRHVESQVAQSWPDSLPPHGSVAYQAPPAMGIFQARVLGVGCHFLSGSSQPRN